MSASVPVLPSPTQPPALEASLHALQLKEPFRIAHGTSRTRTVLRIRRGDALAEAPFVPYYPETPEESLAWIRSRPEDTAVPPADCPRSVRLALDLLHLDWEGKRMGKSLSQLLNIPVALPRPACRSLSIPGNLDAFRRKILGVCEQFSILKLKLGSGSITHDRRIVEVAREAAPEAVLFADANGGWSEEEALQILPVLKNLGLAFVEQPLAAGARGDAWMRVRKTLGDDSPPVFADESAQNGWEIRACREWIDGVNIKLLKCGSFAGALEAIRTARELGLQVLLGCMIESSLGTTAASHLAPLADWIDLDGHLWVENDDFTGVTFDSRGMLLAPTLPGIGARRNQSSS